MVKQVVIYLVSLFIFFHVSNNNRHNKKLPKTNSLIN